MDGNPFIKDFLLKAEKISKQQVVTETIQRLTQRKTDYFVVTRQNALRMEQTLELKDKPQISKAS